MSKNDFMGLGNSSGSFERNTLVITNAGKLTEIALSIRVPSNVTNVTATVWKINYAPGPLIAIPFATSLVATIPDGNVDICSFETGEVDVQPCDLISVRVNWLGGALSLGACAAVKLVES